jgi:hypothetical protein
VTVVTVVLKEKARDGCLRVRHGPVEWEGFEPLYTDADRTGFLVGPWANASQLLALLMGRFR